MKKIFYSMFALMMATFTMTSCEDVPAPYDIPANGGNGGGKEEVTGDGTETNPFTVTDVKSQSSGTSVFVKGYIVGFVPDKALSEAIFSAENCEAQSNVLIAASADETSVNNCIPVQLPVGDVRSALNLKDNPGNLKQEVTLCGNIENYFGTKGLKSVSYAKLGSKEFGTKPGEEKPITGEAKGSGTQADPYNVVAANKYVKDGGDENAEVYVKGKVVGTPSFSSKYGSISYYISDDGTETNKFYVYGGLGLNKEKFTSAEDIKAGDEVVICGKLKNYNGTYEFNTNNYLYSLNGKTGSTTDQPSTPPTTDTNGKVTIDDVTVTLSNTSAAESTENITFTPKESLTGNGTEVTTITLNDGTKLTFAKKDGETNGPKYYSGANYGNIRVYKNNTITVEATKAIAKIVINCDANGSTKYVGNATATLSVSSNTWTYDNLFTESSGGGVQLRINSIVIYYAK